MNLKISILVAASIITTSSIAQSQQDKAFNDLDKEIGLSQCPAKLKSQTALITKATDALQRLDKKVTELTSQLNEKQNQIQQLEADKAPVTKQELAELRAQVTKLDEYKKKNAEFAIATVATTGAYEESKKTLEKTQKQNQKLIRENQSLQQQLERWKQKADSLIVDETEMTAQAPDCPAPQATIELSSASCSIIDSANLKRLKIKEVTATTTKHRNHSAGLMIDKKVDTSWASADHAISGQSIRLTLVQERKISKVHISMPELYWGAKPPKQINLHFSNGSSQSIKTDNKFGWQRMNIQPVVTDSIEVEFIDVDKQKEDSQFASIIVAEVDLFGE